MAFKPDIDFSRLLETGVMSTDELVKIFGRKPTRGDLTHVRESFRSKYPDRRSLIRTAGGRAFLMDARHGHQHNRAGVAGAVSNLTTKSDLYLATPTAELTQQEQREHRVACDAIAIAKIEVDRLRKSLPKGTDR